MTTKSGSGSTSAPRTLRLRIIDLSNNKVKVSLALPVSLVGVAQRLGAHLLPPNQTVEGVVTQVEQHGVAELAWVDATHEERLELTVE